MNGIVVPLVEQDTVSKKQIKEITSIKKRYFTTQEKRHNCNRFYKTERIHRRSYYACCKRLYHTKCKG